MEKVESLTSYVCDHICKLRENTNQEDMDSCCERCELVSLIKPLENLEEQQDKRENSEYYIEAYGSEAKKIMELQMKEVSKI